MCLFTLSCYKPKRGNFSNKKLIRTKNYKNYNVLKINSCLVSWLQFHIRNTKSKDFAKSRMVDYNCSISLIGLSNTINQIRLLIFEESLNNIHD